MYWGVKLGKPTSPPDIDFSQVIPDLLPIIFDIYIFFSGKYDIALEIANKITDTNLNIPEDILGE